MHLFITCPPNLEDALAEELQELGIPARRWPRGVSAPLSMENVYIINYGSHLATRVLWPLAHFDCDGRDTLYDEAKKIPWTDYLSVDQTFAIDTNVTAHPEFKNSHFAGLVVKDAICDVFREKTGSRPSVDIKMPHVQFTLFIYQDKATISVDTSGTPLFKRNYRIGTIEAPLQETLAAAILRLADYTAEDVLCDPFCGSGTFLWEAALLATHTPAGYFRKHFGFFNHPLYREEEWRSVKNKLNSRITALKPYSIFGGDRDLKTVELCRAIQAHTKFPLHFQHSLIENFRPLQIPTLVVANPPYGNRLKPTNDPYTALYNFLATTCQGRARAAILSPLRHLPPPFKRQKRQSIPLVNGGMEVFLHFAEI